MDSQHRNCQLTALYDPYREEGSLATLSALNTSEKASPNGSLERTDIGHSFEKYQSIVENILKVLC